MNDVSHRVFGNQTLEEAFPNIDPGLEPFGERVIVMIKMPPKKTKGGLFLTLATQETDADTCQVAKIVSVGPLAFKHRTSGEQWVEGAWYKVGDHVRVPKYLGDRWAIKVSDEDTVVFAVFKDLDIIGRITGDPLLMRSFI